MSKVPQAKILYADASVIMQRAVSLILKKEPFDLITCDNGEDAFRLAQQHRPVAVFADIDLPGITGIELFKKIRENVSLKQTKLILLCGTFNQVDEARIEKVSADGKLWKPFEAHVFISLLKTLLKNKAQDSDLIDDMTQETFVQVNEEISQEKAVENLWAPDYPTPPPTPVPSDDTLPFEILKDDETPTSSLVLNNDQPDLSLTLEAKTPKNNPFEITSVTDEFVEKQGWLAEGEFNESKTEIVTQNQADEEIGYPIEDATGFKLEAEMENEIRRIMREEIQRAFKGWLKEQLESDLSLVLKEIETL